LADNVEQALLQFVQPGKIYQPDPVLAPLYDQFYRIYLGLYPALRDSFRELGAIDETPVKSRRVQESRNNGDQGHE